MNYEWQYNRSAPFVDILMWCVEKFSGRDGTCGPSGSWDYKWGRTIHFRREIDYAFFLLRWA
jgi:hypothetical protein